MALTTSKLIINLSNGQSIQTQTFSAADLAGALGTDPQPATVQPVDLFAGQPHHIVTAHITDFYEVPV